MPDDEPAEVLYLTSLRCQRCDTEYTFAHEDVQVPADLSAPWPDRVVRCPGCGGSYPGDLAEVITEVTEAARYRPESRQVAADGGRR